MAAPVSVSAFEGFSPDAIAFLVELGANNDRAWFQPRKAAYERLLKEPLEALLVALAAECARRSLPFAVDPKRSPFRFYRDTRFSRDKSPYKTHVGASFTYLGGSGEGSRGSASAGDDGPGGAEAGAAGGPKPALPAGPNLAAATSGATAPTSPLAPARWSWAAGSSIPARSAWSGSGR